MFLYKKKIFLFTCNTLIYNTHSLYLKKLEIFHLFIYFGLFISHTIKNYTAIKNQFNIKYTILTDIEKILHNFILN